ncbi:MAG TPA: hypothetical protein PKV72_03300 [Candidatus Peribacteria bacterium]|nr:hypothetical protein [Candidatus Peribacteria bacterium]
MAIERISGPGGTPEYGATGSAKKAAPGTPTFGEVLAAHTAPDVRAEFTDTENVNRLLAAAQDPAALAIAMSVVMSWEIGRREAIRAAMEARQNEAGMDKLLAAFAAKVTTVQPVGEAAAATVEGHVSVDRAALEMAMRLRLQQEGGAPEEKKD